MKTRQVIVSMLLVIISLLITIAPAGASPIGAQGHAAVSQAGAAPAAQNQLLKNPGFEKSRAWVFPLTTLPASYSTAQAHKGLRSARTGAETSANNIYSYSDVRQAVTIPAGSTQATLAVWLWQWTTESPLLPVPKLSDLNAGLPLPGCTGDLQYALVIDQNNHNNFILAERKNYRAWTHVTFDVLAYKGQTVNVDFGTLNDGCYGYTGMYVDEVKLKVQPAD